MLTSMLFGLLLLVLPGLAVGALPFVLPRRWPAVARALTWAPAVGGLLLLGQLPSVVLAVLIPLLGGAWRPRPDASRTASS